MMRVGIVCDFQEEHWTSMDLVAAMLSDNLAAHSTSELEAVLLRPALARRLTRLPIVGRWARCDRTDRVLNRFWDYPRWLDRFYDAFDVFHIVDHSYAHLVHALPPDRTVVTCHDTDAFLSLVAPGSTQSKLPKWMTKRILSGLRHAAHVTCDSLATADDLKRHNLVAPDRMSVIYNGVHPACSPSPDPPADLWLERIIGEDGKDGETIDLLHVGSTIPRKRIDVLLRVVAAVRDQRPNVRLLKAGGAFTSAQRALIRALHLESRVVTLPFLEPAALAALYRRAAVVLLPSEREGFGLPIVEAMACCTPVVATDLPVLREVGGMAARYAPLDDVRAWRDAVLEVLLEEGDSERHAARRRDCFENAAAYTWRRHATSMASVYREVCALADRRMLTERTVHATGLAS
jgi:glycosyltransferase involved in cell wall biosynthesis